MHLPRSRFQHPSFIKFQVGQDLGKSSNNSQGRNLSDLSKNGHGAQPAAFTLRALLRYAEQRLQLTEGNGSKEKHSGGAGASPAYEGHACRAKGAIDERFSLKHFAPS